MKSAFRKIPPAVKIIVWFIIPIILGGILLFSSLSAEQGTVSFIDALFTATSAFCVTGLTVVNIPNSYSTFGEVIIIILMQLGGLGVMTFTTLFFLVFAGRISSGKVFDLRQTFTSRATLQVKSILKSAFFVTLIVEGIGVIFLYFPFSTRLDPLHALYFAIFHSVSAFNNAGLSIAQNGLQDYHSNIAVVLGVAMLIIIGGIGFTANMEIADRIKNIRKRKRLTLHTKLVIVTTALLLAIGTILFVLFEMNNAYGSDPWHLKIVSGFFQAVTPRTAGFDTVPQNNLTVFSILITILLMIIGASPGSTGGGIKTSSFAVIVMAIRARLHGQADVEIFKRTVSRDSVIKAVSIFILAVLLLFVATITLLLFESNFSPSKMPKGAELDYLFETVSAFGTVGLSTGITPGLHTPGKLILIIMMIIGRVGLLTMFYVIARPEGADRISYSEESVMIG
ncbi:MAG TPA: Trk family potassium uptake protein [candidate division Zixibacteria bacterium]|nr:Trk family potassium uptake protein [candidate division Zixibacteria bacterium]